ncbi:DapH/DapD/GlmU-related protein [Microbacterium sp. SCN 69-37]|uniref:DapH/DapD/GlmU-related protein n=1 Tax=Microbacterium sp. SCN 69-37 TaxID=1660115 RepID=UPI0025EC6A26|nr:DapH/DapD/GlmU-related protein [Microbacterium sp. SCN 69-37]
MRAIGVTIRDSRWVGEHPAELSRRTVVGSDVWIGFGAIVLSGISIGDSAVVGAGAVVTSDVPTGAIVTGNPAAVVGYRFEGADLDAHWATLVRDGVRPVMDIL